MKKLLIFLVAFWVFGYTYAQDKKADPLYYIGAGASDFKDDNTPEQYQLQIGDGITWGNYNGQYSVVGFPYGILYITNTFLPEDFTISKGYFSDKVLLKWQIKGNEAKIARIKVYRTTLEKFNTLQVQGVNKKVGLEFVNDMNLVATLSKEVFQFADEQVQGGVLYKYIVVAEGVSEFNDLYVNYIEGIGFRNPTANVSGAISFKGGSPVKDVKVTAEAVGSSATAFGSSMQFKDRIDHLSVKTRTDIPLKTLTIQNWMNFGYNANQTPFEFTSSDRQTYKIVTKKINNSILLSLQKGNTEIFKTVVENNYPTGEVDTRGDDVYKPISGMNTTDFIHYSLVVQENKTPVLYLNGRPLTAVFLNKVDASKRPALTVTGGNLTFNANERITKFDIGKDFIGYIDELRVWSRVLDEQEIRRDFKRYLNGSEGGLKIYLRMDENAGNFAYDISRTGFDFHKNHAQKVPLSSTNITFSNKKPTKEQLGVYGITGKDGSYTISAIPYKGTGEQFVVTPSLGVHKFKPASQTLFLGENSSVANKIDFEDISSFKFHGRVVYDARGVFKDEASRNPTLNDTDPILKAVNKQSKSIREVGYNQYLIDGRTKVFKGKYFYEPFDAQGNHSAITVNSGTGNLEGGRLRKYAVGESGATDPTLGVEGASLYIDGNMVFDEDNQPVLTDKYGYFNIQVPIGKHKVEVKKHGHTFLLNGRFPEKTENKDTNLFEFYEDQIEPRWFIDNTRVTLIGRVTGGKTESEKELGFGTNGLYEHKYTVLEKGNIVDKQEIISSKNNIGKANVTFKANKRDNALDVVVKTNEETGEFKVDLVPFIYHVKKGDINVVSNPDLKNQFLDSDEELNFTQVLEKTKNSVTTKDNKKLESIPFNFKKVFRYNSPVSLEFMNVRENKDYYAKEIKTRATATNPVKTYECTYPTSTIGTDGFDEVPAIYVQNERYKMIFEVSQRYINKDSGSDEVVKEYYDEGSFNITNNLALLPKIDTIKKGAVRQYAYSFKAGFPNLAFDQKFKKSISIEYKPKGMSAVQILNKADFKNTGIIIGAKSAGGATFVTSAPERPDIILRDPPGSNSFATIEKGTSISFTRSRSEEFNNGVGGGFHASYAPTFRISTGILGFMKQSKIESISTTDLGFNVKNTLNKDRSSTTTYVFNQSISTSDDPDYVGADGDLYIGNSKNVYTAVVDVLGFFETTQNNSLTLKHRFKEKNKDGAVSKPLYLAKEKTIAIGDQPTETYFMYSQKHILETLIPNLEELVKSLERGQKPDPNKEYKTPEYYRKQIKSWKLIIQENERKKYEALNSPDVLKSKANEIIDKIEDDLDKKVAVPKDFRHKVSELKGLVNTNFKSNKSFDAGLGEYSSSYESITLVASSWVDHAELSEDFKQELGAKADEMGKIVNFTTSHSQAFGGGEGDESEQTTKISYTLKDNDKHNYFSIDVINAFDGNGAIFAIRGGYSSCPYEGEVESNFYKKQGHNKEVIGTGGEKLSEATVSVYRPEITAKKEKLTDIPESQQAVFKVQLKNTSTTNQALEHLVFVDKSDLQGLKVNLTDNGARVMLEPNKTVEFPIIITKPSELSTFKFENIKVYLGDPCEGIEDIKEGAEDTPASPSADFVSLSVEFKKSCSKVTISEPQSNWVFNRQEAFSYDANGKRTNNPLPITFTDFNTDFSGFKKIELQYRNANSSSWTKFKTYYGSAALKTQASDDEGIVINAETKFTYNWDIVKNNIADGNYEIRAVSYCSDNVENVSSIVKGTINLAPPVLFGTPEPSDGILDIGEDIKVRFNEPISQGVSSDINIRGLKNQQAIDHSVSLALDGSVNNIELPKQGLTSESFTIQFWYKNGTNTNGTLLEQKDGAKILLNGDNVTFQLNGESIKTLIDGSNYNFYSFIYKGGENPFLEILQNGKVLKTRQLTRKLVTTKANSIFVGGAGVKGNIHNIRIWNKAKTSGQASVEKDLTLTGKEKDLQAYWQLNEGLGKVGYEKVRNRHAKVNVSWSIKPKGDAYEFSNNSYLTLDNVGFVQPTSYEDITLSFWIKANQGDKGTIFSNGTGAANPAEPKQTNGFRNKWSVSLLANGILNLRAEGVNYELSNKAVTDGKWHHVALVVRRRGTINSYIDGKQATSVSSEKIGGIAGAKILLGARINRTVTVDSNGIPTGNPIETIDEYFTGKLDEFRVWNTARDFEQLKRDRYFELDRETTGLMLYVNFNKKEANVNTKGPRYNIRKGDGTTKGYLAVLNDGTGVRKFVSDGPSIKPALSYVNIPFTTVINKDEMIIVPNLTAKDWSLFEGQILDISVASMYDAHYNKQLSPVSFSAYVNRQELEWFTKDKKKELIVKKPVNQPYQFVVDVVNKGGKNQPYTISGLPSWLQVSKTANSLTPKSSEELTFTVDKELAMGTYEANLYLNAANNYTDKISVKLRVIKEAPDWSVNTADYGFSMNVIGNITIDNKLVRDAYTKVGAFVDNKPRGEAYLQYDKVSDSYIAYLSIYSNKESGEKVTFKVWNAEEGKISEVTIDDEENIQFIQNDIKGTKSSPSKFKTGNVLEQIVKLNKGWTWITPYVDGVKMRDIKKLFTNSNENDLIKSRTIEQSATYTDGLWKGNLKGIKPAIAYKVKMGQQKTIVLKGSLANARNPIAILKGWNMLPFPIHRNVSIQDALAYYNPTDGDVVKSQFGFAIYDQNSSSWNGNLRYLKSGEGYMIKSGAAQSFTYANNFARRGARGINTQNDISEPINLNLANYENNMNLVVEVVNKVDLDNIKVFDTEGKLRGTSKVITDNKGRKLTYLTVFGSNSNEDLNIRLSQKGKLLKPNFKLNFEPNLVLGTFSNPYQLQFETEEKVSENPFGKLVVYPNPFSNKLHINTAEIDSKKLHITVYTTAGNLVYNKTITANKEVISIDLSTIASGTYMLNIVDDLGKLTRGKIIKK